MSAPERTTASEREAALLDALREWQDIASDLSAALLAAGGHVVGTHESPQQYDSMSSLACTLPACRAALISGPSR